MKRLLDDSGSPRELRDELLASRRAGHDYDTLAKLPQLRAALERATSATDGSALERETASSLERFARAGRRVGHSAWKLVLLAAAIGTSAWLAWPAQRSPAGPIAPTPAQLNEAGPEAQPRESPSDVIAPAPAPNPPASAVGATPGSPNKAPMIDIGRSAPAANPPPPSAVGSATRSANSPPARDVGAASPAVSPRPAAASSRREIAQLVRIRALLEDDPAAAYRLAQRSEREFPHGVLSEERRALQVLALAKSGATEAADRNAREFLARYPQSPLRELVEAALQR
jgi:hypothetical protein